MLSYLVYLQSLMYSYTNRNHCHNTFMNILFIGLGKIVYTQIIFSAWLCSMWTVLVDMYMISLMDQMCCFVIRTNTCERSRMHRGYTLFLDPLVKIYNSNERIVQYCNTIYCALISKSNQMLSCKNNWISQHQCLVTQLSNSAAGTNWNIVD